MSRPAGRLLHCNNTFLRGHAFHRLSTGISVGGMAVIYRFRAQLTGFIGGPGVNTWFMAQAGELGGADQSDLEGMAADIAAVYDAVKANLALGLKVDIFPVVEGIDVATGNLVQVEGITPPASVSGSGSASQSRATQYCVRLKTDAIRGNRVLQGRHFIGPVGGSAIGTDGQVQSATRTAIQAAYGGVLDVAGNGRLVVYSKANPSGAGGFTTGAFGYVQQAICNSVPGTLRSRKV